MRPLFDKARETHRDAQLGDNVLHMTQTHVEFYGDGQHKPWVYIGGSVMLMSQLWFRVRLSYKAPRLVMA
eukprot:4902125-Karenia_brevis.AAC.1